MRRVPAGSGSTTRPSASDTGAPGVTASPPDDPIGPIGQGPPRSRSVPRGPRRRRRALDGIGGVAGVEAEGPSAPGGGHVALKGTGPEGGRSDPAGARQLVEDRLAEPGDVAGRAEEPGVAGDAVHHPGVVVVDLAGRGRPGRKGPEPLLPRCRLPRPRPAGGRDVAPRWGPGRG